MAEDIIRAAFERAKSKKREELLKGHTKNQNKKTERIVFPITFHQDNEKVVTTVRKNFKTLVQDPLTSQIFTSKEPLIAYKKDKSLKDLLVKSKIKSTENPGTIPCKRPRCLTCKHTSKEEHIIGPKGHFHINAKFSCCSRGLIYYINCKQCGSLYVGETGRRLSDRFGEHRRSIIKNDVTKEVAQHFNQRNHGVEDAEVGGLIYVSDELSRKVLEQKIIQKLGCLLGRGMNTDVNFINLIEDY